VAAEFDRILDECLDAASRGEDIGACLARHPEHAGALRPLLEAAHSTAMAFPFTPSGDARAEARHRFEAALADARRQRAARSAPSTGLLPRLLGWSRVWATAAAVLVVAVVSYFGLRTALSPAEVVPDPGTGTTPEQTAPAAPTTPVAPQPGLSGNFAFLISDDVNAIDDFSSLIVTISGIGLQMADSDGWVELEPEVSEVDLTLLRGDVTQEVWRGDVPTGSYSKAFIQVSDVSGILKGSADSVPVKLPSGRLQISIPFEVGADSVTSFVFDVTVVAAGNEKSGVKYILKPVISESGATVEPRQKARGKD
jgi:hypothetical protein